MKTSTEKPAIYDLLHKEFGVDWDKDLVITFGDTVYCKSSLTPDLEVHEGTHVRQQTEMGAKEWWLKYIADPNFRKSQEGEAYKSQWNFFKTTTKDREKLFRFKLKLVGDFSGKMYGNICTSAEANKIIGV